MASCRKCGGYVEPSYDDDFPDSGLCGYCEDREIERSNAIREWREAHCDSYHVNTRLSNTDPDVERMIDAEVERILRMSDDEIRADYIARGEDPDEAAKRVGKIIKDVLSDTQHKPEGQ